MTPKWIPELLERTPPLISKGVWRPELKAEIDALPSEALWRAGLHLWNDDIESGHQIVQDLENPDAYYWHAIVHRREPDFSNSRYWYRRLGAHPVLARMRDTFPQWDPIAFTQWCEQATKPTAWLETVQAAEMKYLLEARLPAR